MGRSNFSNVGASTVPGRQLFSTAALQDQIAKCCCLQGPAPSPFAADIQIFATLTATVDSASGLASLLLTMNVINNGPATAIGVNVAATVPALSASTVVIRAVPVSPLILAGSTLQANLGTMTNGQSRNMQCTFIPLVSVVSSFTNVLLFVVNVSGSVSAATPDPNPSNNTFLVSASIPTPAEVTGFTGGGARPVNEVSVSFGKSIQPGSLNSNTVQIANVETGAVVGGSITYDDSSTSTTFSVPGNGFPAGGYQLTLIGTGSSPIVDVDGLPLDGDGDRKPGGNYTHQFGVG